MPLRISCFAAQEQEDIHHSVRVAESEMDSEAHEEHTECAKEQEGFHQVSNPTLSFFVFKSRQAISSCRRGKT
jgi:hypothetical protein